MTVAEQIYEYVKRAPEPIQAEVLNFVQFLLIKAEADSKIGEEADWSHASLTYAMRGLESEDSPQYTVADVKETYS
jgi:hypothetical protein